MNKVMIHAFKKCPSVCRPRGFFYYSETARLWIVQNWLTGDWFFEKETDKTPSKVVHSRQHFKTPHKAMAYLDSGEPLIF